MSGSPTCGEGMAQYAAVPERTADLFDAMADNLEIHTRSVRPDDPEAEAWTRIAQRHRTVAGGLREAARDMAAQRDLPMGPHDEALAASADARAALERFERARAELAAVLGG
jgi:hypothetical protein